MIPLHAPVSQNADSHPTPIYDEASHTLTLRFRETTLSSGARTEFSSESDQWAYEEFAALCQLPTAFPAGPVVGSNGLKKIKTLCLEHWQMNPIR